MPSTCPHKCHFVHIRELRDKGIYTQQHVTHGSRTEQVSFPNSTPTPEQSTPRTQCIPLPKGSHLAHVQPEVPAVFNSCPGFAVREVLFWLLLFLKCECVCAHVCEGWRTILSAIFRNAVYLILDRFSPCSTAHQLCHTGWPISPRDPPASASPK